MRERAKKKSEETKRPIPAEGEELDVDILETEKRAKLRAALDGANVVYSSNQDGLYRSLGGSIHLGYGWNP